MLQSIPKLKTKRKTKGQTLKKAKAFAPAAISSFFEIHDTQNDKPIADLEKVGAIGGGFGLEKGVTTTVTAKEAEKNSHQHFYQFQTCTGSKNNKASNGNASWKNSTKYIGYR